MGILQRARDGQMDLKGYYLNDPLCEAFFQSCCKHPDFIDSLHLENNGLRDQATSKMIDAMAALNKIAKIAIVNNQVGLKSYWSLDKLLSGQKGKQSQLVELRICQTKMSSEVTQNLLLKITEDSQIRKLSLVNTGLPPESIEQLKLLVKKGLLRELDISWNQMRPTAMQDLVECLGSNRTL